MNKPRGQKSGPANQAAPQPDITPEMIEKMSPAQQRELAHTLKETAIFFEQVKEEDLKKVQAIPWEKLQKPFDPKQPLTDEDKESYLKLLQLVKDGVVTMAQVLGYGEAELYKIYSTGMGLADQGRYEDAMKLAEGLLFLVPKFVPALMLKADVLRKTKRTEEAYAVYDEVVGADPTFIQAYFERAKLSFAAENWEAFIMDMESVVTLDPEAKTVFGKFAREAAKMAEEELLRAGVTVEEMVKLEEEILAEMEDVPLDQIPEIDDEGNQIRKA
jgi:tetratricopeptide (TPR) repeat protein